MAVSGALVFHKHILFILGNVYNITPYLDFHPGGVDELMRGAGKDGTALFDEVLCFTLSFNKFQLNL